MQRRAFLTAAGTFALAGCSQNDSTDRDTGEQAGTDSPESESGDTSPTSTPAENVGDEPTVRNTPTEKMADYTSLSFTEWWTRETFSFCVVDIQLATEFTDTFEKRKTVAMPDDQQLLFIYVQVKNISQKTDYPPDGAPFGAIAGGETYSTTGGFDHPDYSSEHGVDMDWLEKAESIRRLQSSVTQEIESGETWDCWVGAVVPRSLSKSEITIGYDTWESGKYEIRWEQ